MLRTPSFLRHFSLTGFRPIRRSCASSPPLDDSTLIGADELFLLKGDLESYRKAFHRVAIPDSLERVRNQQMTVRMTGAETIYRMLAVRGAQFVFGYSGGAVLALVDQFHRSSKIRGSNQSKAIRFIQVAHEQAAVHAAQAVGRLTGLPGIVVVTSGPGVTNCVTGLQDALMDGDPVLLLSGQVPTSSLGSGAFQEAPATALTKPCTKWNYLVETVESIPWALETALRIAMSGRKGPVHIDLPKNILGGEGEIPVPLICPSEHRDLGRSSSKRINDRLIAIFDDSVLDEVSKRIGLSQRPVIIAGHGAVDAHESVKELSSKCDIPVTTTLHGMGVLSEHEPLSLKMLGMHGNAAANLAVQNADLILSIGARFDDRTTGTLATYAPHAKKAGEEGTGGIVHFDIDAKQFGKTVSADLSVLSDCSFAVPRLLAKVKPKQNPAWITQITGWKEEHPFVWARDHPADSIKTQEVVDALYRASTHPSFASLNRPVSVCTGVGNHQMMAAQFYRWSRPKQLITSGGLGTMGSGLPFAIGAQIAHPGHTLLLIDGDGSFNMSSSELATVKAFDLPIKICVINDGVQQMVRAWQHLFFEKRFISTTNQNPDYVKLSESYGIAALRCEHPSELEQVAIRLLTSDEPMLVDFRVVPDFCLPMVKPGSALHEMIFRKNEIENIDEIDPHFSSQPAPS